MNTKQILPIIIADIDVVLPGGVLTLRSADDLFKKSVTKAEAADNRFVLLFYNKDSNNEYNTAYNVGIYAEIIKVKTDEDAIEVSVALTCRATLESEIMTTSDGLQGEFSYIEKLAPLTVEQIVYYNEVKEDILRYSSKIVDSADIVINMLNNQIHPEIVCDSIYSNLNGVKVDKEKFLFEQNFTQRLIQLLDYLDIAIKNVKVEKKIEDEVSSEIEKDQKEYFLHKKLKVIQEELGDAYNAISEADELKEKIINCKMPEAVEKQALKELKRYKNTNSASPESTMIRAYLDTMIELPWVKETVDNMDIQVAKEKLDETHFGLDKVKDRILEYLGVKLYTGKNPQTIICLAGPPGVGKTTLAKSIAEALGRKFVKQSLGGVKDEAEIRGHRRTYLGALPGRIINGIKEAGVVNPVFLLDEIDKLGADYKGDPSASLLEVLDPAQNKHFMDHYLEVEYDLSKVMFICTANELDKVPGPLRDRMEVIELSSYTELEKFQIAKNYVIKKSLEKNGLEPEKLNITDAAIKYVIKHYTREAGARQLERNIDSLVRKAIKIILAERSKKVDTANEKVDIDEAKVTEMLGKKLFEYNKADEVDLVGVVNGLAYTQAGGDTLQIEVQLVPGKGNIKLTGKLGDIMKESAEVAYTWVKANAAKYYLNEDVFEKYDVHIHVPEGAVPKDGPSAGVTITTAILSAFTKRPVNHTIGMTGEITLTGRVLPIGGLKEKSIAAYRNGLVHILIPQENVKDLDDIPQEVKDNLKITPVSQIIDVINIVLI